MGHGNAVLGKANGVTWYGHVVLLRRDDGHTLKEALHLRLERDRGRIKMTRPIKLKIKNK